VEGQAQGIHAEEIIGEVLSLVAVP
jgi:hypothetical protein